MPKAKSKSSKSKSKSSTPRSQDAIAILKADHKLVSGLFEDFESARAATRKRKIVSEICQELTIHARVEEEIFYPAVKQALKDAELIPEAQVEHESLKMLISQVEGVEPDGEMYDARVKVMSEYVKHHVKEEQNEMFPKARETKLDMVELGALMLQRKEELKAQMTAAR